MPNEEAEPSRKSGRYFFSPNIFGWLLVAVVAVLADADVVLVVADVAAVVVAADAVVGLNFLGADAQVRDLNRNQFFKNSRHKHSDK